MGRNVSIIGAGNVGATLAQMVVESGLSDVVLFDIVEGMPQGKALDMQEACPLWRSSARIKGSNYYGDTADSDIIVITAGFPRKPGMSRDDLLFMNAEVIKKTVQSVSGSSPEAVIIVITNPMDAMTYLAWKASGFPPERVVGMGGVLDATRLRAFVAMELDVSPADIEALVLGGHGDQMVPLPEYTTVKGVPVTELLPEEKINAIMERTKNGGAEIVSYLKTGSAYYAPAASAFEMAKSILLDEKRLLPCAAYLQGEYGFNGIYAGVPTVLGKAGVEKVVELKLSNSRRAMFEKSAQAVKELINKLESRK